MSIPLPHDDYKVNLEVFEGPLDLLLYLIRRDELDIYDIPIERVAKQYADYLSVMEMLDLNIAGEFIVMAATLALIKSRMLLPVEALPADDADEEEGTDPRWDLVRQLVEYKRFKDAASRLQEREFLQQNVFALGGEAVIGEGDAGPEEKPLGDVGLFDLIAAFNEVLAHAPVEPIGEIEPIAWTVPDKIDMILRLTQRTGSVAFSKLFHRHSPRGEIIVTFLALLELLRLRQIAAFQAGPFTEILIKHVADGVEQTALPPPVIGGADHA
jgi:segregation and condensation protein A